MADEVTRVEIGFDGGLIVIAKVAAPQWATLESALRTGKGVVELAADDDSTYHVDVSKISYVKHETHVARVGF
jgi:hypothetical protein